MNTRWLALVGCLALCGCTSHRELAWLTVDVPEVVAASVGRTFDVPLIVHNTGPSEVTIHGVDVELALLSKCELVGLRPPAEGTPVDLQHYRVHRTAYAVPAGGQTTLTLELRAIAEGEVTGDVDLCLDNFACRAVRVTVNVQPPAAPNYVVPLARDGDW